MHEPMTPGGTVQLADPRADEARPATITMIAIAAGGLGLLFMLGLARVLPASAGEGPTAVHQVFPRADPEATSETSVHAATLPPAADESMEPPPSRPEGRQDPAAPNPVTRPGELTKAGLLPTGKGLDEAPKLPSPAAASASKPPTSGLPEGDPGPRPQTSEPAPGPREPGRAIATPDLVPRASNANATEKTAKSEPALRGATDESALPARAVKRSTKPIFERGVVAYVRCEGSELRDARFPCPRDRKLEEQVWSTLGQLVDCADTNLGRGSAELRITLQKARAHAVDFRSSTTGTSLNLRAVSKCAGSKLANARTSLKGPHAVVSFRFGLK